MPCLKSVASVLRIVLFVSAVTVGAHPYHSESSYLDSIFNRRNDMNVLSMQVGQTCPVSGACEVCQTAQIGTRDLHVCPSDGDRCNPTPCFYTSECRCGSIFLQSPLLKCNSSTTVVVEGISVNVNHYILITPGSDPNRSCFTTEPVIDSCTPECDETCSTTDVCLNNTRSGNLISCNSDGCECITPRYLQPNCCLCDTRNYYLPGCNSICRPNCATFRPTAIGGCASCFRGFDPPGCCNCSQGKENIGGTCKCEANVKTDGSGDCKEGYTPEDCCNCTSGYTKNGNGECKRNVCDKCVGFSSLTGECSSCTGGFVPPTCCNCPAGKTNISGTCKCSINVKTDGSGDCKEGYAPDDCCNCGRGYTKNGNGECKPDVCDKCVGFDSQTGECSSCTGGFVPPTCCNCPADKTNVDGTCKPDCNINQNIYFLLDGTRQNMEFCTMGITIQMLVAAFNPGLSSAGTRISTVLFPNKGKADVVFNTSNSCDQIEDTLKTLQTQMQTCQDSQQDDKSSITYTSLCGSNTVAVAGLDKIRSLIQKPATTDSAVVILTDGQIDDPADTRVNTLDDLADSGLRVESIIAGGIKKKYTGATDANLKLYNRKDKVNDRVVLADDPVGLGLELVREMKDVGLICPGLAKNITSELKKVQTDNSIRNNFCRCHNIQRLQLLENHNPPYECIVDYPTCGGPVSINAVEKEKSLSLEEEILAAVENVLQEFEG